MSTRIFTKEEIKSIASRNLHWSNELSFSVTGIATQLGLNYCPLLNDVKFIEAIVKFQADNKLTQDGILGPNTYRKIMLSRMTEKDREFDKILSITVKHESGGRYDAINVDGEYRGLFDAVWIRRHGYIHPASGRIHIGLSVGLIQWTQDSGSMGVLLKAMSKRDPKRFRDILGPTSDQVVSRLTRSGPSGLASGKQRGPRCHPIPIDHNGKRVSLDLWEKPWIDRVRGLLQEPVFQLVQDEQIIIQYLKPSYRAIIDSGLRSEKAIAIFFARAIAYGGGGARTWLRQFKGLSESEAVRQMSDNYDRGKVIANSPHLSLNPWQGLTYLK